MCGKEKGSNLHQTPFSIFSQSRYCGEKAKKIKNVLVKLSTIASLKTKDEKDRKTVILPVHLPSNGKRHSRSATMDSLSPNSFRGVQGL